MRSVPIVRQESNPLLDASKGMSALLHGLLSHTPVCCQSCLRVIDACALLSNPGGIGGDEGQQFPIQFCHGTFGQYFHVQHQVSQSWYLYNGRSFGTRHIVRGYDAGRKTNSFRRVAWYGLGMHTDTVTNGKAHLASVEHSHSKFFI